MSEIESLSAQPIYHVAIAADRNFSIPLGLSCLSLIRCATAGHRYHIHILGDEIDRDVVRTIQEECDSVNFPLTYHDLSSSFDNVYVTESFPAVAFARLLLPNLLPDEIKRVYYLDADTIFCKDPEELFTLDMGENILAGVQDFYSVIDPRIHEERMTLFKERYQSNPENFVYCFSGQIVLELDAWRKEDLGNKIIRAAQDPNLDLTMPDQDLINVFCQGRIQIVPPSHCLVPMIIDGMLQLCDSPDFEKLCVYSKEEVRRAVKEPDSLHYATHRKVFVLDPPQLHHSDLFYKLWRSSPWRNTIPYYPYWIKQRSVIRKTAYAYILYGLMQLILLIPYGYEMYWGVLRLFPASFWPNLEYRAMCCLRWIKGDTRR